MAKKRPIDLAREYREQVLMPKVAASEPWPLAGLKKFSCERILYFSLKPNETPNQLFRILLKHHEELLRAYPNELAGGGNMMSLIVTPAGDGFCSFRMAKFSGKPGEAEADLNACVDRTTALQQTFGAESGRYTATIEGEAELVCSDGRRFLLSECECVSMMTSDLAKKFKLRR